MANWDRSSGPVLLDAAEACDYGPVFDSVAQSTMVENRPGAGPG